MIVPCFAAGVGSAVGLLYLLGVRSGWCFIGILPVAWAVWLICARRERSAERRAVAAWERQIAGADGGTVIGNCPALTAVADDRFRAVTFIRHGALLDGEITRVTVPYAAIRRVELCADGDAVPTDGEIRELNLCVTREDAGAETVERFPLLLFPVAVDSPDAAQARDLAETLRGFC